MAFERPGPRVPWIGGLERGHIVLHLVALDLLQSHDRRLGRTQERIRVLLNEIDDLLCGHGAAPAALVLVDVVGDDGD